MMFFLHKMDRGVLWAVEVRQVSGGEKGKKGVRVGEVRGCGLQRWRPERRAV